MKLKFAGHGSQLEYWILGIEEFIYIYKQLFDRFLLKIQKIEADMIALFYVFLDSIFVYVAHIN